MSSPYTGLGLGKKLGSKHLKLGPLSWKVTDKGSIFYFHITSLILHFPVFLVGFHLLQTWSISSSPQEGKSLHLKPLTHTPPPPPPKPQFWTEKEPGFPKRVRDLRPHITLHSACSRDLWHDNCSHVTNYLVTWPRFSSGDSYDLLLFWRPCLVHVDLCSACL
jgi:hypothetical protein